jgi:predicted kinase
MARTLTDLMFIQMSGAPGAGKTTIAMAIAKHIRAVIIDHDITKSALLEANVPVSIAGRASYEVLGTLAQHLLKQHHSVIFDSPCFYENLLERGQRLAEEFDAEYRYVECVLEDLDELDRRLRTRPRLPSQVAGVRVPPTDGSGKTRIDDEIFRDWIANMKRPQGDYLVLDTSRPLEVCIKEAITYVKTGQVKSRDAA